MLKVLRDNTKTVIWLTVIIFIAFTVIGTALSTRGQRSHVATIFGKNIPIQMYRSFYDALYYSPRFQNLMQNNPNIPESFLANTALQYIALYIDARKRGIKATDNDVRNEIAQRYSVDGVFNPKLYEYHVKNIMHKKLRDFEESLRKELTVNKLLDSLRANVSVTDEEARQAYDLEKSTYTIDYLVYLAKDHELTIPLDQDALRTFYNENKQLFAEQEKYNFNILHFTPDMFSDGISITDKEIEDYYAADTARFTDENGETKPLDTVRDTIKNSLTEQRAIKLAQAKAEDSQRLIQDSKDFNTGAAQAGVSPQRIEGKTADDLIEFFGWVPDFYNKLPAMAPNTLKTLHTPKGSFVLLLTEKEFAFTPPFESIIDKVKEKYLAVIGKKEALKEATDTFMKILGKETTLADIAQKTTKPITSATLTASMKEPLDIGAPAKILNALRATQQGSVIEPFEFDAGYALISLQSIVKPTDEVYSQEKTAFKDNLTQLKSSQVANEEISVILKQAQIKNLIQSDEQPFADIQEE